MIASCHRFNTRSTRRPLPTVAVLVVFGANGNLTARKLIPALYALFSEEKLPTAFAIVGVSRTEISESAFRQKLADAARRELPTLFSTSVWERFARSIFYFSGDVETLETFARLKKRLDEISTRLADQKFSGQNDDAQEISARNDADGNDAKRFAPETNVDAPTFSTNWIFYLAISPRLYSATFENLEKSRLALETATSRRRLVVEKPFGVDLESARKLDAEARAGFDETRFFRVDHYLGKDAVDNVFALRFANAIFEPLWNRRYVESVLIAADESATVGRRGAFYESTGALRDVFQSHLLQLLAIAALEPPARFDARSIREEKAKLLRSVRIPTPNEARRNLVLGQYDGYRTEPGVAPDSNVPTFAALRLAIDNWRWKDVPFFLRGGKGTACRTTFVEIRFKEPPRVVFSAARRFDDSAAFCAFPNWAANRLTIQIQPAEGVRLSFLSKIPGTVAELKESELVYSFEKTPPDAYRRLLLDAIDGDPTLFASGDEIESAWKIIDPFQRVVDDPDRPPTVWKYRLGERGPKAVDDWTRRFGSVWNDACPTPSKDETSY